MQDRGARLSLAISASGSPPLRRRLRRQLAVADGRNSAAARSPCSCSAPASLPVSGCSTHGKLRINSNLRLCLHRASYRVHALSCQGQHAVGMQLWRSQLRRLSVQAPEIYDTSKSKQSPRIWNYEIQVEPRVQMSLASPRRRTAGS